MSWRLLDTIGKITKRCYICGKESMQAEIYSTNAMGYSDLDFRPAEMERSTMCYWVEECPHCGYVAEDISEHVGYSKYVASYIAEDEYKDCGGFSFKSELAKRFYKQYLLFMQKEDAHSAFTALLHVAWACDDLRDQKRNATHCRIKASYFLMRMLENLDFNDDDENSDYYKLILVDILRRSGEFTTAIEYANECLDYEQQIIHSIANYQIYLANNKDRNRYTIGDALKMYPLPEYIYCSVYIPSMNRAYYYITDNNQLKVGDKVLVPFGVKELIGEIEDIKCYEIDDVPFPLENTKKIIRKQTETN